MLQHLARQGSLVAVSCLSPKCSRCFVILQGALHQLRRLRVRAACSRRGRPPQPAQCPHLLAPRQ